MTDDERELAEHRERDREQRPDQSGTVGTLELKGAEYWRRAEAEQR